MLSNIEHRQGCPATGGYGHGIEPCICGADPSVDFELSDIPESVLLRFPDMDVSEFAETMREYARSNVARALQGAS